MLSKLLRKKPSAASRPRSAGAEAATPPPLDDERADADDAYAEKPISGARVTREEAEPSASQADNGKKGEAKGQSRAHKGETASAADVENPRHLIAEAIGSNLLTLARTNTVLKFATLSLSGISLVLALAAYAGWNKEPEYRYFFVSNDGTVLQREPLNAPVLSLNNVRDFYAESLSHLFSFHYRNFADHYQRVAPNIMTERAMQEFASELDRIGLLGSMTERREVAEAVILQTPVLNASGIDPSTGLYTWELSVPFNLRLESGRGDGVVRRMGGVARVQVVRVEPTEHPRQILINRITIRDTTNND